VTVLKKTADDFDSHPELRLPFIFQNKRGRPSYATTHASAQIHSDECFHKAGWQAFELLESADMWNALFRTCIL